MTLREDYAELLDTESGTRVLRHIAKLCGARGPATSVVGGIAQPYNTMYNDGRKSIWLNICEELAPEDIFLCEFPPATLNDTIGEPEANDRARNTSNSKQRRSGRK